MFTSEQGKRMNTECALALDGVLKKVCDNKPDLHARLVMSNCLIALTYLEYIHAIGIDGYTPIAVSLCRTYLEIVCSTIYLADHKEELDDFLKFGRLLLYDIGEGLGSDGRLLNQFAADHEALRAYFKKKRERSRSKQRQLSWHGMSLNELRDSIGLEKFAENEADVKSRRSQHGRTSKLVHGDSLIALLAYNLELYGLEPTPFASPMEFFRTDALSLPCALFLVLLASVSDSLKLDIAAEYDRLNARWRQIWEDATGTKVSTPLDHPTPQS
jgi:hypothetical protein